MLSCEILQLLIIIIFDVICEVLVLNVYMNVFFNEYGIYMFVMKMR